MNNIKSFFFNIKSSTNKYYKLYEVLNAWRYLLNIGSLDVDIQPIISSLKLKKKHILKLIFIWLGIIKLELLTSTTIHHFKVTVLPLSNMWEWWNFWQKRWQLIPYIYQAKKEEKIYLRGNLLI